jgi:hypothetical protein
MTEKVNGHPIVSHYTSLTFVAENSANSIILSW